MTTLAYSNTVNPGDIIAVGDIHARYDLLELFLDSVRGTEATVIFLGDLIDRGGQDAQVLNKVRQLMENPESEGLANVFVLMGNHEAMLIDAATGPSNSTCLWLQNGGNLDQYSELLSHLGWLQNLPIYMTIGETMFIHAGLYPGKNPADTINSGQTQNLLWMREPFLTCGPEFEKWNPKLKRVVFGHTPFGALPYEIPQGICIDTAAFMTGTLTAYNATRETFFQVEITNDEKAAVG
jgi:serine/threonine protein phosphatase 1